MIDRKTFETWLEVIEGSYYQKPRLNHSKIGVQGIFSNGVKWTLKATALSTQHEYIYYGRKDDWNTVALKQIHLHGPGARSEETHKLKQDLLSLLEGAETWRS